MSKTYFILGLIIGLIIGLILMYIACINALNVNNQNLDKAKEQIVDSTKPVVSGLTNDETLDQDFLKGYSDAEYKNYTTMSELQHSDPNEQNPRTHKYFDGWNAKIRDEEQNKTDSGVNNALDN